MLGTATQQLDVATCVQIAQQAREGSVITCLNIFPCDALEF